MKSMKDISDIFLKGIAGISLILMLNNCSNKDKNFWETKKYKRNLKNLYELAEKTYPEYNKKANMFGAIMLARYYDTHETNPSVISKEDEIISKDNVYYPSLYAIKEAMRQYEIDKSAIERGEDPSYRKDFFKKN